MPPLVYATHKEKKFECLILNSSPLHDLCFVKIIEPKNSGYKTNDTEIVRKSELIGVE